MLKIDAHHHFWLFDPVRDAWITEDMYLLQKDFLPEDIQPVMQYNEVVGCIAVQARQSEHETMFLLGLGEQHDNILGIVGWVDLQADDLEDRLIHFKQFEKLKGFRHSLQAEPDIDFMLKEKFGRGVTMLNKYGFSYDLLIKPEHLISAKKLVSVNPGQRFIVDHMAKPIIKGKQLQPWQDDLFELAQYANVSCKISGILTEADWYKWEPGDFTQYLDVVFHAFGPDRVMFGSDWPVCTLAGGYNQFVRLLECYMREFSSADQALFWGENALNFYAISKHLHTP